MPEERVGRSLIRAALVITEEWVVLISWLQNRQLAWRTQKKNIIFFFKYSTDNDGKGLFRVYRAGTVHCLKTARRPYNVGETREVRGQGKPQMCRLSPPERTSGTFSDVSDLSHCFSSLVMMSLWETLIVQVWKMMPLSPERWQKINFGSFPEQNREMASVLKVEFGLCKPSFVDESLFRWFDLCLGLLSCSRRVLACDEVSLSNTMKHSSLSLPKD